MSWLQRGGEERRERGEWFLKGGCWLSTQHTTHSIYLLGQLAASPTSEGEQSSQIHEVELLEESEDQSMMSSLYNGCREHTANVPFIMDGG